MAPVPGSALAICTRDVALGQDHLTVNRREFRLFENFRRHSSAANEESILAVS
jgi:hypothetical protein